jgi:mono/diheme cytochrome c family protein
MLITAACVWCSAAALQAQDTALGKAIFEGKGNCYTCHGKNASGTPLAPDLRDSVWLNIDGSASAIRNLIRTGVVKPKQHPGMMPPLGGARLNEKEVDAVAAYVIALRTSGRSPTDPAPATPHHSESTGTPQNPAPGVATDDAPAPAPSPGSPRCGQHRMRLRMGHRAQPHPGCEHCY